MEEDSKKESTGYRLLQGAASLLALLPFGVLYLFSDLMFVVVYHAARYRRKLVKRNLAQAFPDKSDRERKRIEREFYRHLCDYFVETIKTLRLTEKEVKKRMKFENPEILNRLMKEGNACLLSLGHYANWEWVPSIGLYMLPGVVPALVYKQLHSDAFDRLFRKIRSRFDSMTVEKRRVYRTLIKARNEGTPMVMGFLSDQRPPRQDTMFVIRDEDSGNHLRIFFATRHQSLRDALNSINVENQVGSIQRAYKALQVFGVPEPRLATAAINPHGGEGGAFGSEEIEILTPAVEAVNAEGLGVAGPIPADSVFHHGIIGRYDGILSQYHDQGHIAAKTYDFDGTISVTVGLPILRTSVDHGTAFDIAGKGIASHGTMRSAYLAAVDYAPFVEGIREAYMPKDD